MKVSKRTAYAGIAALVLGTAAPGFAQTQQAGASCPPETAQVRAQIWRAQAAMDIARTPAGDPASGTGRALASAQGHPSGIGRTPAGDPASGVGRTPTGDPASGAGRVSSTTNAQFRVLASAEDRKAFVTSLSEAERKLFYESLSNMEKKRLASAVSEQEMKGMSEKVSDPDAKAWAELIVKNRAALNKKIQQARALARTADELCKKGDSAGAATKAKEAMDVLK